MAFETFLTVDKQKPKKSRRITYAVSVGVHAVLLVVGVVRSYASVEELSPKGPVVTFAMPPPPPPPAAGPKGGRTRRTLHSKIAMHVPNVVHPPTEEMTTDHGDKEGPDVPPGDEVGCKDCEGPPVKEETTILPPKVGVGFLAIDPQAEEHRPHLPAGMRGAGMRVWALMKVCVDQDGKVVDVQVMKGFDASVDASFIAAMRTWRYTPYKVNGRPVPFCTPVRYEVQTN
jgi:TonB family protein